MRNAAYTNPSMPNTLFEATNRVYSELQERLVGESALSLSHGEIEHMVETEGRELLRCLLQSHLTLRGMAVTFRRFRLDERSG